MFTELHPALAYRRREEIAREVSSGRLEDELRAAPGHRSRRRWSFRLIRVPWALSNRPAEARRG